MKLKLFTVTLLLSFSSVFAQEDCEKEECEKNKFRVAAMISHTYFFHNGKVNVVRPAYGLDIEYWIKPKWGIGLFSDIEIDTDEQNINGQAVRVDRDLPVVLTGDFLWSPISQIEFIAGIGAEFKRSEKREPIMRFGVEYELDLGSHWDVAPAVIYDYKFGRDPGLSVGIAVGRRF